jgi:hypothetical protein
VPLIGELAQNIATTAAKKRMIPAELSISKKLLTGLMTIFSICLRIYFFLYEPYIHIENQDQNWYSKIPGGFYQSDGMICEAILNNIFGQYSLILLVILIVEIMIV